MEARQALAFVARRQAKQSMSAAAWAHVMSLELGWMSPSDAKAYVRGCIDAGLLTPDGDDLATTFDADHVEVPRGFRPDARRRPEAVAGNADPFHAWLAKVAGATGRDEDDVLRLVADKQEEYGGLLEAHAALLLLAAEAGLDVQAAADEALSDLKSRRAKALGP